MFELTWVRSNKLIEININNIYAATVKNIGLPYTNEYYKAMEFLCCHYTAIKKFFWSKHDDFCSSCSLWNEHFPKPSKRCRSEFTHNIPSFNTPFCAKFAFVLTREHIRKRAIHLLFSHSIKWRSSECLNQAGTPHEKYNKRFANFTLASCLDKLSWKIFLRNLASELECEGVTLKVKSSIGSVKPLFSVAINWTVRVYSRSIVVLHLVGGRSVGDNQFSRN